MPQHFLYFSPEPQGQGLFLLISSFSLFGSSIFKIAENNSELKSTVTGENTPESIYAVFVLNKTSSKFEKSVFKTSLITSKKFSLFSLTNLITLGGILSLVKNSFIHKSLFSISSFDDIDLQIF